MINKLIKAFSFFMVCLLFSCSTTQKNTDVSLSRNLDNSVNDAAINILDRVPANTKVALVNTSTEYFELTNYVLQEIAVILVNKGNLEIVEREATESIEKEHAFQMSGVVSDSEVISIVEKYGAQSVVSCTITGSGNLCRLRVRTLDVRTGKVQSLNSYEIDYDSIPINANEKFGGLTVLSSAVGILNIKGMQKNIALEFKSMTSQFISDLPIGEYLLTMTYNDGKVENNTIRINENQITTIEFKYQISNLWVLSIGNNRYSDPFGSLRFCNNDAMIISDFFKSQEGKIYNHVYTRLITDGTKNNIINGFNFLHQANSNDTIILYFAGHAHIDQVGKYVYIASDTTANRDGSIITNAVTIDEILPVLNITGNKIVIIDTNINDRLISDLRRTGAIIYLPGVDGIASELLEFGHGVFTYSIIDCLSGGADINNDGYVNAKELGDNLIKIVSTRTNGRQQPLVFIPDGYENYILSRIK